MEDLKKYFGSFIGTIGLIIMLAGLQFLWNAFTRSSEKIPAYIFAISVLFLGWYVIYKRNKWL